MDGIAYQNFMITNEDSKLRLFLRNKHLQAKKSFSADKTILYVHGTTQPCEAIFDLQVGDMSFADHLASEGFDVWYLNIRGYGHSEAPKIIDQPFATTEEALSDLKCALKYVFNLRKIKKINLMGWSWGTIIVGAYAAENPKQVSRLVLMGAPWVINKNPSSGKYNSKSWQEWTAQDVLQKLRKGAPRGSKNFSRTTRIAWEKALAESQPEATKHSPAKFRSPTGVLVDAAKFWHNGVAYYNPAKILAKVLICWGAWDMNVPLPESQDLLANLTQAEVKELRHIPKSTHMMQIEENRAVLYHYVQTFLES